MNRESNPIKLAKFKLGLQFCSIAELEVNPRIEFNWILFLNIHFYSMESRKLCVFTDKGIIETVTFLKIWHIDCTELYFTVWIETIPYWRWKTLTSFFVCCTSNANEFACFDGIFDWVMLTETLYSLSSSNNLTSIEIHRGSSMTSIMVLQIRPSFSNKFTLRRQKITRLSSLSYFISYHWLLAF